MVKDRPARSAPSRSTSSKPGLPDGTKAPPGGGVDEQGILADRQLVERCLGGEVGAWEQFYEQCHPALLLSIEIMLGPQQSDPHLVDEIAARVWYALVANDGGLLARYEPGRGARLITFLRALAKDETSRHFRAERRRRQREQAAWREKPQHRPGDATEPVTSLGEFLATLTPHERGFCGQYLLAQPSDSGDTKQQTHSSANVWQLSRRIHRKLLAFLDRES